MTERYKELQSDLQQAVHDLFQDAPLSDYLDVLADSTYANLQENVGANPERKVLPSNEFTILEGALTSVYRSLTLMAHLAKIYERNIEFESYQKKEVQNG